MYVELKAGVILPFRWKVWVFYQLWRGTIFLFEESDLRRLTMRRMASSFMPQLSFLVVCIWLLNVYVSLWRGGGLLRKLFKQHAYTTQAAGMLAIIYHNNRECMLWMFVCWNCATTQTGTYIKLLWPLKDGCRRLKQTAVLGGMKTLKNWPCFFSQRNNWKFDGLVEAFYVGSFKKPLPSPFDLLQKHS